MSSRRPPKSSGPPAFAPRKRKAGASSATRNIAAPSSSGSAVTPIDLTSSPEKPTTPRASSSNNSQLPRTPSTVIDLSSSPVKAPASSAPSASAQAPQPLTQSSSTSSASRANVSLPPSSSATSAVDGRLVQRERQTGVEDPDATDNDEDPPGATQEEDVFYVRVPSEVVGIQYYTGLVGVGERVTLRREPHNQYDYNAIQVLNMYNQQVGHVPRFTAARLASLMDRRLINVEGIMQTGNLNGRAGYKLKMLIDIYGPLSSRDSVAPQLAWAGRLSSDGLPPYDAVTQVSGSRQTKKAGEKESEQERRAREIMEGLKDLDKGEQKHDALLDSLTKTVDVLKLPHHPDPPTVENGQLRNNLLPHQSQGLLWMQQHENPALPTGEDHVQLWQKKSGGVPHWLNIATRTPAAIANPPALGRGGIMADAMGLGKTLTILSLVLASKAESAPGFSGTTLIVCPLSVLSNWETQIEEHLRSGLIKFHTFHGDGRHVSASKVEECDVVLTTYQVLSSEFGSGAGASKKRTKGKSARLLDIKWKRVVLDEGHTIRNPKAAMSKACVALVAHRRWVVSGTPIVNGAKDLGSLLSFLRICKPLDEPEQYQRLLLRNLQPGGSGAALLQAIMSHSCLRRTKEMEDENGNRLVPLPPVNFYVVKVDLLEEDRRGYDIAMEASKREFQEYLRSRESGEDVAPPNVLQMLTRLRQLALLSTLVPPNFIEDLHAEGQKRAEVADLTPENKKALIFKLKAAVDDAEECPICFDTLSNPRITICGHSYCLDCIVETIKQQAKCPMDRSPLPSQAYLVELPEVMPSAEDEKENDDVVKDEEDDENDAASLKSSAKIDELLKYLTAFPKGQKSLVFSQFTSFLSAIEPHLKRAGINFVRFDGTMSAKKRAEVIEEFQTPLDVQDDDQGSTEMEEPEDEKPVTRKSTRKGKGRASATPKRSGQTLLKPKKNGPTVMLISLKSGSVGLNLTAAQNVFMMDPWWQSAIEMQAIDRVNRIGQTASEVRVFQMIAKNTIEDKVLEIQGRKNELIQQAFAGLKTKETARQKKEARFNELRELFGVKDDVGQQETDEGRPRLVQTTL